MKTTTDSMSSSNPVLTCKVIEEKLLVDENSQFDITISIADSLTSTTIPNIAWNVNDFKFQLVKKLVLLILKFSLIRTIFGRPQFQCIAYPNANQTAL